MRDGYGWRVFVLKSASFAKGYRFPDSTQLMYVRSVTRVFHTCGKNCGNSTRSVCLHGLDAGFARVFRAAKVKTLVKPGLLALDRA
jgi:hypothetical protein